MENYKGKSLADTVSSAGSMFLFLLFSVCMLVIIVTASFTYSKISNNFNSTFNTSAVIRYVSNRMRSADSVEVREDGIVLYSDGISVLIWCNNGEIFERSFSGDVPKASGGDKIFEADRLEVTEKDGVYEITVQKGEDIRTALLRGEWGL